MPDRAVVDEVPCAWCSGDGYVTGSMPCPECTPAPRAVMDDYTWVTCSACGAERLKPVEPTPRALVALSADRQWMCCKLPEPFINFCIYERVWFNQHLGLSGRYIWEERHCVEDTGQSADAVLAAWEGRHEG